MELATDLNIARNCIQKQIEGLNGLFQVLETPNFSNIIDHCVDTCRSGGRIAVAGVGKNSYIAEKAVASMASLGILSIPLNISYCSHGDFGIIGPRDFVIHLSRSGNTAEMLEAIHYLSNIRPTVKQALIHCNSKRQHSEVDFDIWCGDVIEGDEHGLAPTTSTTSILCVMDALTTEVSSRLGFEALDFFKYHPGGSLGKSFSKVGFIYKTTNIINGKFYVGQCSNDPRKKYLGSGKILLQAIEKYGRENFRREILQYAAQEDLNFLEQIWIEKLRAQELGYNILPGGNGGWQAANAKPNGMLGKKHSPDAKRKMSEQKKAYLQTANGHPRTGQKHTAETKQRLSELRKNVQPSNVRKLIGPDGTTYKNITEAKEKTNLGFRRIEKFLKDPSSGWKIQP